MKPQDHALVITFGASGQGDAFDGDEVDFDRAVGLQPADLQRIELMTGADAHLERGSVGVGASGAGIELWLAYASVPGDLVSLVAIGAGLRKAISWVQGRRPRSVVVTDPPTLAALAAETLPTALADEWSNMEFIGCRNLLGGEPPNWVGTDDRHVWVVMFQDTAKGLLGLVFMSPSGERLGQATVPILTYLDAGNWRTRSESELVAWRSWTPPA